MLSADDIRDRKWKLVKHFGEKIEIIVIQWLLQRNRPSQDLRKELRTHVREVVIIMIRTVKVDPWPEDIGEFAPLIDQILFDYLERLS